MDTNQINKEGVTNFEAKQLEVEIKKVGDSVESLSREVHDLQRQVETMDEDRKILEEIQNSIRSLESASHQHSAHIETIFKALKLEVQVQAERTGKQVEGVKEKVEAHVGNLVHNLEGKKVIVVQETWLAKLKKKLKGGGR